MFERSTSVLIHSVSTGCLILSLLVAELSSQRGRGRRRNVELKNCTFKVVPFKAESLSGRTAEYGIYLPRGYELEKNAQTNYPWAIWLHGMRGSLWRFHSGGAAVYDRMLGKGTLPKMIMVTPSASRQPLYMDGGSRGDEESFIVKDVLAHVEKNYRVSRRRGERAMMGVSLGAMGAMRIALRHPQVFGAVAVHSSPVLPADPEQMSERFLRYYRFMGVSEIFGDPIDSKKWAAEIPLAIIGRKKWKEFDHLQIYFDAGSSDRYHFGPPNKEMSKILKKKGIPHTFNYIMGGGHSWGTDSIQTAMKSSLKFVAAVFRKAAKKAAPAKVGGDKKAPR